MKNKGFIVAVLIGALSVQTQVFAEVNTEYNINSNEADTLYEYGYSKDMVEALGARESKKIAQHLLEDPSKVDLNTTTMEVDTLSEIERFLTCTKEELIEMGAEEKKIDSASKEINKMISSDNETLTNDYNMNNVEIKMLRKTVENAKKVKKGMLKSDDKEITNKVTASGSITSSEMTYSQTVIKNGTAKSAPNYDVIIGYTWSKVYALAVFDDNIAVAWGGYLNSNFGGGTANYYKWILPNQNFRAYYTMRAMSVEEDINSGLILSFPQSVHAGLLDNGPKTKQGVVSLTLYQNKLKGYDTKVKSVYCHRMLEANINGISVSASGPEASINVGKAFDKCTEKVSIIKY